MTSISLVMQGPIYVPPTCRPSWVRAWAEAVASTVDVKFTDVVRSLPHPTPAARWTLPRYAEVPEGVRIVDRRVCPPGRPLMSSVRLRPYQVTAVAAMMRETHGVLEAPCGSGKTTMGLALIAQRSTPALVLVHTYDLQAQWVERAQREIRGVSVATWDGSARPPDADVVVAMIQAIAVQAPKIAAERRGGRFGLVLVDECHHAPARTWAAAVDAFPARYRYGLTATPTRLDALTGLTTVHLGPIRHTVPRDELEARGAVLTPTVNLVRTGMRVTAPERNDFVVDLAVQRAQAGRRVLVLVGRVDHAQQIAKAMRAQYVAAASLVGPSSIKERSRRLAAFSDGTLRALVATQLADEALDLPALDCVVLAAPTRAVARAEQRIGRALRPAPGKPAPEVWDLIDEGAGQAARARRKLYDRLEWPVVGD